MKAKTVKKRRFGQMRGYGALTAVGFTILAILSISLLVPTIWALITTFKTEEDFYYNVFGLPERWAFENYAKAFIQMNLTVNPTGTNPQKIYVWQMFGNGVIYAVGCTFVSILVPACVAYGCARFRSIAGSVIHATVLLVMVIPIVGSLPSEMQIVRALGFYNNMLGMFVMKANFLGTNFLIFYAAFKGVSQDYADAASIDGAGHWTVMLRIMFPLVSSVFSTLALLALIGFWNDSQTPLQYLPDVPNLALGLFKFNQKTDGELVNVPMKLTGCFIMFMPILIIFIAFRKKIMMNVSIGGLKG